MANTNETNKVAKVSSAIWGFSKSIALLGAVFCVIAFVMGWGRDEERLSSKIFDSEDIVYGKTDSINDKTLITDEGTYYSLLDNEELCIPYASIYAIKISDTQYLQVQQEMTPSIVRAVERELPNGTPNEKLLRCAYYSYNETEAALNEVLGVTLSASWEMETIYTPSEANNQQEYSYNGRVSYNAYE